MFNFGSKVTLPCSVLDADADCSDMDINDLLEQDDFEIKEFGPALSEPVANKMDKIVRATLSKDQIQQLKASIKVPSNCKTFQTPKLNPEIWSALQQKAKYSDVRQQTIQQNFTYGLAAFAGITELITKSQGNIPDNLKQVGKEIVRLCVGGANFMSLGLREASTRRRQSIRPHLSAQYSGICSTVTENGPLLFGENLAEKLRQSRTVSNIMKFQPTRPYQSNSFLNYRGQNRRFRGNIRGRPFGNQRYFPRRRYPNQANQYPSYDQNRKEDQFRQ